MNMNLPGLLFFGLLCFSLGFLSAYFMFKADTAASSTAKPARQTDDLPIEPKPGPLLSVNLPISIPEPKPVVPQPLIAPAPDPENVFSGALARAGRIFEKPAKPVGKSISGQIDAILQEKIIHSDDLNLNIHLVDLEDHSLGVILNGQTYAGIDIVPDERAKTLIRAAVTEWQRINQ